MSGITAVIACNVIMYGISAGIVACNAFIMLALTITIKYIAAIDGQR